MRFVWKPHDDAELKALTEQGLNHRQIAARMGLKYDQVRRRAEYIRTGPQRIYSQGRVCAGCPKPLTDAAKGNLCRSCNTKAMNADDSFQAVRIEGIKRKWQEPLHRAKMARVGAETFRKAYENDPSHRERLREWGRKIAREVLHSPEVRAKTLSPEVIAKRAKTQRETLMGWCPPEYRAEYRKLTVSQRFPAADARKIIMDQVNRDKAKAREGLSPFERQELALKRGAKLVANDHGPSLSNPANYGEERWSYGRSHG